MPCLPHHSPLEWCLCWRWMPCPAEILLHHPHIVVCLCGSRTVKQPAADPANHGRVKPIGLWLHAKLPFVYGRLHREKRQWRFWSSCRADAASQVPSVAIRTCAPQQAPLHASSRRLREPCLVLLSSSWKGWSSVIPSPAACHVSVHGCGYLPGFMCAGRGGWP